MIGSGIEASPTLSAEEIATPEMLDVVDVCLETIKSQYRIEQMNAHFPPN